MYDIQKWGLILIIKLLLRNSSEWRVGSKLRQESSDMIDLLRGNTTMAEFAAHHSGYGINERGAAIWLGRDVRKAQTGEDHGRD